MDLFTKLPSNKYIFKIPKYIFKKGDLVQEMVPENFPTMKDTEAHFVIVDSRLNTESITVKNEGDKIKCEYHFNKSTSLRFYIYEKDGETNYQYHLDTKLSLSLAKKGIKADSIASQQVNRISIMLAMLENDYAIQYQSKKDMHTVGKNCGKPVFVGSKNKLAAKINGAYPFFRDRKKFQKKKKK